MRTVIEAPMEGDQMRFNLICACAGGPKPSRTAKQWLERREIEVVH
jgi:hypothetical protein